MQNYISSTMLPLGISHRKVNVYPVPSVISEARASRRQVPALICYHNAAIADGILGLRTSCSHHCEVSHYHQAVMVLTSLPRSAAPTPRERPPFACTTSLTLEHYAALSNNLTDCTLPKSLLDYHWLLLEDLRQVKLITVQSQGSRVQTCMMETRFWINTTPKKSTSLSYRLFRRS